MTISTGTTHAPSPVFVDDDSWAQPRDSAGRGWKLFAGVLAGLVLGLVIFGVGARYGRSNAPTSAAGRGGFGGLGAGGFGGAGTGAPTGANGAPTAEQLAQIFGQNSAGAPATPASSSPTGGDSEDLLRGTIVALTADQLTLKRADGSTVKVALSSTTPVGRRTSATRSDLVVGQPVEVRTTTNDPSSASEITVGQLVPREVVDSTATATASTTIDPGLGGLLPG